MVPDSNASGPEGPSTEVMASVDDAGSSSEYVIADLGADEAWLSISVSDAPELPAWR